MPDLSRKLCSDSYLRRARPCLPRPWKRKVYPLRRISQASGVNPLAGQQFPASERLPTVRGMERRGALHRCRLAQTRLHVVEDVHEVDVAVVRAFVRAEVLMHVAVGPVLRAHVVEVVARRQLSPVVEQLLVALLPQRAFELVQLV